MVQKKHKDSLSWLLEPDSPSARYLALCHLLDRPQGDPDVIAARSALMRSEPVQTILDSQYPAGYWIKPDRGYSPRHKATIWQLICLADLGCVRTPSIARACDHVLSTAFCIDRGLFSAHKHSTGLFPCLNGDLLRALWHFGYGRHPIVRTVAESLAQRVIADGLICVRNGTRIRDKTTWLPCTWGCVKVLRGFAAIPGERRSLPVHQAIERGIAFLLSCDITQDQQPALVGARSRWLRFSFPSGYGSDLLEALVALGELGATAPPRDALQIVLGKRDPEGHWPLEHALPNTWAHFGAKGEPSKWVTMRALRVINWFGPPDG